MPPYRVNIEAIKPSADAIPEIAGLGHLLLDNTEPDIGNALSFVRVGSVLNFQIEAPSIASAMRSSEEIARLAFNASYQIGIFVSTIE